MDYNTFGPNNFRNVTSVKNDITGIDDQMLQNINQCNYSLQNYFINHSTMKQPIDFATSQPGIMYKGPVGYSVEDNSSLNGSFQTHPRGHIDLYQRPFVTVPYLGRGSVDPVVESQIMQGEVSSNRNSVTNVIEKNYTPYYATPLIPSVQSKISNPSYLVEETASNGWVRGGVPSRELTRDKSSFS